MLQYLLTVTAAYAAEKEGVITGKVQDEQGVSLPGAHILLRAAATGIPVKVDVTDGNGSFFLEAPADSVYELSITITGMQSHTQQVTLHADTVNIPVITMKPESRTLEQVTVRAQKPMIEVQADKIVVNVENSILSTGASALEVLGRSPGVRVDQNDQISLKGRPGVTIMIDGRIMPVSGTDLANLLKSMPSASVEKIEIISNPGARYDAAGTAGIINIRTKKDQRMGVNGSVQASYIQGIYPKAVAGGTLSYRNKKVSLYTNYNYSYRYWFNHLMLDRRFYDTATGRQLFRYDQDNTSLFDFSNHTGALGLDYRISKNTATGFAFNGGTNHFNPKADNASRALGPSDELLYYFNTTGKHRNRYYNAATNVYLRHTFDDKGKELSMDADYAVYANNSRQQFITRYTTAAGDAYQPDYLLKSDLTGLTQIRSFKADYISPLPQDYQLETGIKTSYVTADNEPLFYEMQQNVYELDTKRSNHFLYNENINAAYMNVKRDKEKWGIQLGLRGEHTNADWQQKTTGQQYDTSYIQLFPSIAIQRHITQQHDLGLTLSRRIERPNYQQLNPFKFFIDKTTYREGYPYLKPALSYMAELSHTFKQKFITTLTYSITDNVITEVIQPSDHEDSVTVQTHKNLRRMTFLGISGAYSLQVAKWWTNVTGVNAYYAFYEGFIANTNLRNGKPTFDLNTNNSFMLPAGFSAELGFWYQARQIYGFMDVQPVWMLNAGIQRHFLDKQATVRLNIQDIFWTSYPKATSTYTGYQEDFVAVRDTRQATISFTYRFGNKSVGTLRQRSGGAEEEKRRAGTGNA